MTTAARLMRFGPALLCAGLAAATLSNGRLSAEFDDHGIVTVAGHRFNADRFSITIDGVPYDSTTLSPPSRRIESTRIVYSYTAGRFQIDAIYELRAGWEFLSKQLVIRQAEPATFRVNEIKDRAATAVPVRDRHVIRRARERLGTNDYGVALRFDSSQGILAVAQNPFISVEQEASGFAIGYKPDMEWNTSWGAFESDRLLLAPYRLSGHVCRSKCFPNGNWARAIEARVSMKPR